MHRNYKHTQHSASAAPRATFGICPRQQSDAKQTYETWNIWIEITSIHSNFWKNNGKGHAVLQKRSDVDIKKKNCGCTKQKKKKLLQFL